MPRLFGSFRRGGEPPPPTPPRRVLPPPSELRRERRTLLRLREQRLRDLGGVVLEMYRQDSFRETLLYELAAEVAAMEERLRELDVLLEGRRAAGTRCACGAPLLVGARFCASCGRPGRSRPAATCRSCGHALPGDAAFCAACGTPARADREAGAA